MSYQRLGEIVGKKRCKGQLSVRRRTHLTRGADSGNLLDTSEEREGGDGEDRVHDREVRMSSRLRWRIECEGSLGLSVRSSSCFYTLASKACRPLSLRVCVESSGYWLLASEGQLLVSMQLCET